MEIANRFGQNLHTINYYNTLLLPPVTTAWNSNQISRSEGDMLWYLHLCILSALISVSYFTLIPSCSMTLPYFV